MENLRSLVDQFRLFQNKDGSVQAEHLNEADGLLHHILPLVNKYLKSTKQEYLYSAFDADIQLWITNGLGSVPDFSRTRDTFVIPRNGEKTFFIGLVKSQNSLTAGGYYLDFFLCERIEPDECERLYLEYPHPKNICQSMRLIEGSSGISDGNCIVFFPENILSKSKIKVQKYALFFFSKFHDIYRFQTIVNVRTIIGNLDELSTLGLWSDFSSLSKDEIYNSRCVWGYLHDYFHHSGIKPFDENISLKMNWFVGLLEEINVDLQTYMACRTNDGIPYNQLVAQYILFDRMFRYPFQDDYLTNFDSGTGIFLFNYLVKSQVIIRKNQKYHMDEPKLDNAIKKLIGEIQEIERLDTNESIIESSFSFINQYLTVSSARKVTDIHEYNQVFELHSTSCETV